MALSDRPWGPVVANGTSTAASQPGLNTIAQAVGPLPATLTLTSATETLVPNPGQPTIPLSIAVHPDEQYEQCVFDLFASGTVTTGTTTNVTVNVYEGQAIAGGNLLGTSGAIAQNGTTGARVTRAWFAHARLIYNSVSGALEGDIEFYVNRTKVASVTLSNFVVGFLNVGNPSANPPTVSNLPTFALSFTSSGATAATNAWTFVNVQKFTCG